MDGIIFLDVDGVLSTYDSYKNQKDKLDRKCLENFKDLLTGGDYEIVLTSAWRLYDDVSVLKGVFKQLGIPLWKDTTPDIGNRGKEIEKWIADNDYDGPFVILDDDDSVGDLYEDYWVETTMEYGLTQDDVDYAIDVLDRQAVEA